MRRPLLALAALFSVVGCATSSTGALTPSATAPSATAPPPPVHTPSPSRSAEPAGRPVDIGGRSLYLECHGEGTPTVILEAGLTGDHRTWERVVPALSEDTRVCSYDRANIRPSDPAPKPRTTLDMVEDLDALLAAASVEPPYVLVGFSFGGLVTQQYAATNPDDVAGIVLVESNHPEEAQQFEEHLTPEQISL
ncbi:MAG TPA: alpha/beta hydrolase, partial [Candidatus Limnocylindrales bacterium]|nr:alpha/beta hydrolase [Candidatus Limnocylindrales bacterium]